MAPTGGLVAAFRDRVSEGPRMRIETIHAALRIREGDSHVQYAPPSHLREAASGGRGGGWTM
eukprot:8596902-Alexandrium_andersonii.AAC.1